MVRGQPIALTLHTSFWHNRLPAPQAADAATGYTMKNGLYSIHVSLQDGRSGKGSGVVVFRDGKIFGGDAFLFYTGTYTTKGDTFKGEVVVQRHTRSPDVNPLFGGPSPVGIGVSGTFTDTAAVMNGTALVGKASQIFTATLRKLADSD
jgi:T3SS negative regulator,GrlR